jgi:serine/threonine protein kinase
VLEERIGRGGFGEVWRARHEISALVAAVKLPRDAQLLDALHREGALTGKLDHPLVVAAIEAGLDDDPPWIAFRWIDGAEPARADPTGSARGGGGAGTSTATCSPP